jgi:hypothetical protein
MSIEVEKGMPIPEAWRNKKRVNGYPWEKLEVGDSFVMPKNGHKSWAFAFAAIQDAQIKHRIKLTTRLIDEDNRRVWRTA